MSDHYIIRPTHDGRRLITLCGHEVAAKPVPEEGTPRCEPCVTRLPMLGTARDYAKARAITPAQAARALNMPSHVAAALA